jgi:hypothetical protein
MKTNRVLIAIVVAVLFSISGYYLFSLATFRPGFPLDDAWIHQTYARNLVQFGEWVYIPGKISAGSTSPAWTFMLSAGYLLRLHPIFWVYCLGALSLSFLGIFAYHYLQQVIPQKSFLPVYGAAIMVFAFQFVWAAISGMETLWFALLVVLLLLIPEVMNVKPALLGILTGLLIWFRPEGLTLLGPLVMIQYFNGGNIRIRIYSVLHYLGGFSLIFLPYLLFNQWTAGTIWPTTFYAKQAEYEILLESPIIYRLSQLIQVPIAGVGALILPGYIRTLVAGIREKNVFVLASFLWILGTILMYAIRLPVTYQHGRYLIPILPVFFVLGIRGMYVPEFNSSIRRILTKVWHYSTLVLLFGIWLLGANAYAKDVAIIESEMVDMAKWISKNTELTGLIAAHDIGALGYFGERDILDLAGLISPEVIPYIRDEMKLIEFINEKNAKYLMTFPDWYEHLPDCGEPVFVTSGTFVQEFGEQNMHLYRWQAGCTKE